MSLLFVFVHWSERQNIRNFEDNHFGWFHFILVKFTGSLCAYQVNSLRCHELPHPQSSLQNVAQKDPRPHSEDGMRVLWLKNVGPGYMSLIVESEAVLNFGTCFLFNIIGIGGFKESNRETVLSLRHYWSANEFKLIRFLIIIQDSLNASSVKFPNGHGYLLICEILKKGSCINYSRYLPRIIK